MGCRNCPRLRIIGAMTFNIRECHSADAAELARLRVDFLREVGQPQHPGFIDVLERWFRDALATPRVRVWVAECDGRIVGTAAANPFERIPNGHNPVGRGWYVINVYVLPEARGRGLAEALMRTLQQAAAEAGVPLLELHATGQGRAVYERLGWTVPPDFMELRLEGFHA